MMTYSALHDLRSWAAHFFPSSIWLHIIEDYFFETDESLLYYIDHHPSLPWLNQTKLRFGKKGNELAALEFKQSNRNWTQSLLEVSNILYIKTLILNYKEPRLLDCHLVHVTKNSLYKNSEFYFPDATYDEFWVLVLDSYPHYYPPCTIKYNLHPKLIQTLANHSKQYLRSNVKSQETREKQIALLSYLRKLLNFKTWKAPHEQEVKISLLHEFSTEKMGKVRIYHDPTCEMSFKALLHDERFWITCVIVLFLIILVGIILEVCLIVRWVRRLKKQPNLDLLTGKTTIPIIKIGHV